jgi:ribosomal protein S18 acetylase RimI-like enzyme
MERRNFRKSPEVGPRVARLSQELLRARIQELLRIDEGTVGEPWNAGHFLADRPAKWQWSRLAIDSADRVEGFLIASRKGNGVHCHRIAVREDRRSKGVGVVLLRSVAGMAAKAGLDTITCKVARRNPRAIRWYERLGFSVLGEENENLLLSLSTVAMPPATRITSAASE